MPLDNGQACTEALLQRVMCSVRVLAPTSLFARMLGTENMLALKPCWH